MKEGGGREDEQAAVSAAQADRPRRGPRTHSFDVEHALECSLCL